MGHLQAGQAGSLRTGRRDVPVGADVAGHAAWPFAAQGRGHAESAAELQDRGQPAVAAVSGVAISAAEPSCAALSQVAVLR
jgi:hypothetical protein